jgi:hypothetical protein
MQYLVVQMEKLIILIERYHEKTKRLRDKSEITSDFIFCMLQYSSQDSY